MIFFVPSLSTSITNDFNCMVVRLRVAGVALTHFRSFPSSTLHIWAPDSGDKEGQPLANREPAWKQDV